MLTLKLPWKYELFAMIKDRDSYIVVTQRKHSYEPYAIHRCNEQGDCYYGHYFQTLSAAYVVFEIRVHDITTAKLDGVGKGNG